MFSVLYGIFSVPLFVVWMTHTEQQGKTCQIADIQMTLSDAQIWKIIFLYHFSEQSKLYATEWGFWEVTGALWGQPKQSSPAVLSPGMRLMQIPKALPWFLSFCCSLAKTGEGKRVNTIWYCRLRVYKGSSKTYHRIEKLKRIKSLQWHPRTPCSVTLGCCLFHLQQSFPCYTLPCSVCKYHGKHK